MLTLTLLVAALVLPSGASAYPGERPRMPRPPALHVEREHVDCPEGTGACADVGAATIYVARGMGRFALAHEIGHIFDFQVLTDADRSYLTRLLGTSGPWLNGTGSDCIGHECPAEWFADAYAACEVRLNPRVEWIDGAYMPRPKPRRLRRICFTIQFLAWYRSTEAIGDVGDGKPGAIDRVMTGLELVHKVDALA